MKTQQFLMPAKILMPALMAVLFLGSAQQSEAQQDLKIKSVQIEPRAATRVPAPLELSTSANYRFTVAIQKALALSDDQTFLVKAECLRDGQQKTIGQCRVGDATGWSIFACFNAFPSSAGPGKWRLRVTIDSESQVAESDESAASNVWEREVIITGPGSGATVKLADSPKTPDLPDLTGVLASHAVTIRLIHPSTGKPVALGSARIYHEKNGVWKDRNDRIQGGIWKVNLPAGRYRIQGKGDGLPSSEASFDVKVAATTVDLKLKAAIQ